MSSVVDGTYRWDSEDYAKHSAPQFEWARELIVKLRLQGDESILDIGSGDGKVTALLAKSAPRGHVIGIDNSPDMLAMARRTFFAGDLPNLTFMETDARNIRFQDGFDIAFSNATLHWIQDHRAILTGVKKCLKKGGRLLFQMGGRGNARELFEISEELFAQDRWKSFFAHFNFPYFFYSPEEYRPWLAESGLTADRVELIPKDMTQRDREGLIGWMRSTWLPYTERLPLDLRGPFIAEIANAYLRDHPAHCDGMIHVKMARLEVEAANRF
jgi:trans-aconitate 2-methyltransferase